MQVSLVPEESLEFQGFQDRLLVEPVGRMVSQVFLGPKVSLVRSWVPHLEHLDKMVYLDSLETRATPAHQEGQDCLVGLRLRNTSAVLTVWTPSVARTVVYVAINDVLLEPTG